MKTQLILLISASCASSLFAQDIRGGKPVDLTLLPPASNRAGLTYENDIKPLFKETCFSCHGAEKQRGKIRLDSLAEVMKGGEEGAIVVSGDSAQSPLVISVARLDPESAMPPMRKGRKGPNGPKLPDAATANPPPPAPPKMPMPKNLSPEEVGLVRAWIDQGAK